VIEVPEHLRKKAAQWPGLQTLATIVSELSSSFKLKSLPQSKNPSDR
jgi:hypothetical protein